LVSGQGRAAGVADFKCLSYFPLSASVIKCLGYVNWQQINLNSPHQGCFACVSNWWVISLSLFWPASFLSLVLLFSANTSRGWREQVAVWVLSCLMGQIHPGLLS